MLQELLKLINTIKLASKLVEISFPALQAINYRSYKTIYITFVYISVYCKATFITLINDITILQFYLFSPCFNGAGRKGRYFQA